MLRIYIASAAPLADETLFAKGYQAVSAERRLKIDKIKNPAGKRLSLAAGLLLRQICRDLALGDADRHLQYGENGKPCFIDIPRVHFNISHSGDRVMAVASDREIGCDTEKIKTADMRIASRFFSPAEYGNLERAKADTAANENDLFFRYWTAKESFIKCTGKGFGMLFNSFTADLEQGEIRYQGETYAFSEIELKDGYCYAYCFKAADDCADKENPLLYTVNFRDFDFK